jgi:hypothetical protein
VAVHPSPIRLSSRACLGLAALLVAGLPSAVVRAADATDPPPAVPRFVEETKRSGVKHVYDGEWQFFVGGGVAAFDCSGDGRPELYLAGGENRAGLFENRSRPGKPLRFAQRTSEVTDLASVTGAYPLDIDSDGITDLAVLRVGEDVLLRGLGDCRFERANEAWGFDGGDGWTTAFSATWEGGSALPTLAFGHYVAGTDPNERFGSCADNLLFRPDASGTRYAPPIPLAPGFCALSMLFSDWGRAGQPDLRVSNDRHYAPEGEEQLWRMTPGEPPGLYTADEGWQQLVIWGMGIGSHDLTGDGRPEVYLTSQGDNKLQTLADGATGPVYEDIALDMGATLAQPSTGESKPSTSWHPAFEDLNDDGWVDLFVTKGNVEAMETYARKDPNELLLRSPGGPFVVATADAGVTDFDRSRGAAVVDLDLDGMLDVVTVDRRRNVSLWRNLGGGTAAKPAPLGNSAAVVLRQPAPNVDAVGAWIEADVAGSEIVREVTVGGGHASGTRAPVHLGLGDAPSAEVRVTWPDGTVSDPMTVAAGSTVVIEKGAAAPVPWEPTRG